VLMSATLGSLVGFLAGNAAFGSRAEPPDGR
jgi:hypothetical protein